jgi:hypothetical protein
MLFLLSFLSSLYRYSADAQQESWRFSVLAWGKETAEAVDKG